MVKQMKLLNHTFILSVIFPNKTIFKLINDLLIKYLIFDIYINCIPLVIFPTPTTML